MQQVTEQVRQVLSLINEGRSFVILLELYTPDEAERKPEKAVARWATSAITFAGFKYTRKILRLGTVRRYLDKQVNTLSLTLANADLELSRFVGGIRLEGMRALVRVVAREVPDESVVLFAGRADKPDRLNHLTCQFSIRQDYGADQEVLKRSLAVLCPLRHEFKGAACRGNAALSTKTAEYQAATSCTGSFNQCLAYGNTANFQGIRFTLVRGSLSVEVVERKRFLLFFTKKKKRIVSVPYSSVSDVQEGSFIPEVGGVSQVEGVPIMHIDRGARVAFLQAFAGDHSDAVLDLRVRDREFLPAADNPVIALGLFGSEGQAASAQFPGAGTFSGVTWAEGEAIGSDFETADSPSPTATAVVRGRKFDFPDATGAFTQQLWTDVGPVMVRWYLIHVGGLLPDDIDDNSVVEAMFDCAEPVIDDTGFEQSLIPETITGGGAPSIAGFRAFAAASGFGAATIDRIAGQLAQGTIPTGGYGQLVQAYYRYYSTSNFPQFISPVRKVRRRYTTNFVLKEQITLGDFLFDLLLPSFNGRMVWTADGRVRIGVEKAAQATLTTTIANAGATEIEVEDVMRWRRTIGDQILIGAHLPHSEIRRVTDYRYSARGDAITLAANSTGGLSVALSGATLAPSSATVPATGTFTLSGTVGNGDTVTLQIDGIQVQYTAQMTGAGGGLDDDLAGVALYLANMVNGHELLRRFVRAEWSPTQSAVIRVMAKVGFLKFSAPLGEAHARNEETIRIEGAFGGEGERKIVADSFEWPLGSRQSSVNLVKGTCRSVVNDWAAIPIEDAADAHIRQVRKINSEEINLSAVDTVHQAFRLIRIRLGKRRLCDWSCAFRAGGDALLFDVGDVICVSHYSGAGLLRHVPVVIEEMEIDPQTLDAAITARLYRSEIYDDTVSEVSPLLMLPLVVGTATNSSPNPPNPPVGSPGTGSGSGVGGVSVDPPYGSGGGGYGSGGGGHKLDPEIV